MLIHGEYYTAKSGSMKVEVREDGTTVILPCGAVVEGRRWRYANGEDEGRQVYMAEQLGYGEDVLQMVKDHDALHVRLCQWLGLETSPALERAAGHRDDDELTRLEEQAVLSVQKFMRAAGRGVPNA